MKNKELFYGILSTALIVIVIILCMVFIYDKFVWKEVNINLDSEYNELFTKEEVKFRNSENFHGGSIGELMSYHERRQRKI